MRSFKKEMIVIRSFYNIETRVKQGFETASGCCGQERSQKCL